MISRDTRERQLQLEQLLVERGIEFERKPYKIGFRSVINDGLHAFCVENNDTFLLRGASTIARSYIGDVAFIVNRYGWRELDPHTYYCDR